MNTIIISKQTVWKEYILVELFEKVDIFFLYSFKNLPYAGNENSTAPWLCNKFFQKFCKRNKKQNGKKICDIVNCEQKS